MLATFIFNILLFFAVNGYIFVKKHAEQRIIGGTEVEKHIPYIVSIKSDGGHVCGGSIISKDFVLTAAHCFDGVDLSYVQIDAGSPYNDRPLQSRTVYQYKVHDDYNHNFVKDDIGILMVKPGFKFCDTVKPIRLPTADEVIQPGNVTIAGWGHTQEHGEVALVLRQVVVPLLNRTTCRKIYKPLHLVISDEMLCAGADGKSTCKGDSGGPLEANGKLFGVTSFAYGCAIKGYPTVFTEVAKYRDWITFYTGI